MILFHGSNMEVRTPKILIPSHALDFGPVANDDVYRTLSLFREGEITKEEALVRLKIKQLYNQLVFVTPKALAFIRFKGSEVVA